MVAVLGGWTLATVNARANEAKGPPSEAPMEIQRASVTLPYTELRALWEAARAAREPRPAEEKAPVDWIINNIEVHVVLDGMNAAVEAAFDLQTLDQKWQRIPLIAGDPTLNTAEVADRSIVWEDGYTLLTHQAEKLHAVLHLNAALRDSFEKGATLRMRLPAATVKRLSIAGPPAGVEVTVDDQRPVAAAGAAAQFVLGSEGRETVVRFSSAAPVKPTLAAQWKVESQILATYADGRLRLENRLFARADDGSAQQIELLLPRAAGGITVAGEDLADWSIIRSDQGARRLQIQWKTRDLLDRELTIAYTIPQSPLEAEWSLPSIKMTEGKEARSFFAVVSGEALEVSAPSLRYASESRLLPEWMRERVGALPCATAEAEGALTLQVKWLPELKTAEARISESTCTLRLVADGSTQTTVSYTVRHQGALPWQIELPQEVELLSCEVDGQSVRPLLRGENKVEIKLPAPAEGKRAEHLVALVYAAKQKALDPVSGQLTLELPRTPLFIDRLDWVISIPDAYEPTAVSGNLSAANIPPEVREKRDERLIALRKDLCRGEKPIAEIFYQRRVSEK
jgi:hypothetical protein